MKKAQSLIFLGCAFHLFVGICEGNGYSSVGFRSIDPKKCIKADAKTMSSLPAKWEEYAEFVKKCDLPKDDKVAISVVSIWVEEYLENKYPPPASPHWEDFPLPVIADYEMNIIGSLPEMFPVGDAVFSTIHYGKWRGDIPTEIRVDVENPAEGGDYYYSPILYDVKKGKYELKKKEIIHGRRK